MELACIVLGRPHAQIHRLRIDEAPLRIGRSFACDLVLSDPRIDAQHLELCSDESGQLLVCDPGSLNGSSVNGHPIPPGEAVPIESGDTLQLGRTRVQVYRKDHDVGPARSPSSLEQFKDRLSHPGWVASITLMGLGVYLLFNFLSFGEDYSSSVVVRRVMDFSLQAGLWMLFWGAINKLVRGEFNFWAHWCIGVGTVAALPLSNELLALIGFNWPSVASYRLLDALFNFVLMAVALYLALGIATYLRQRPRAWVALLPAALLLITTYALPLIAEKRAVAAPELVNVSRPPGFKLVGEQSADSFVAQANGLFEQAQRVASRQLEREAEESTLGQN